MNSICVGTLPSVFWVQTETAIFHICLKLNSSQSQFLYFMGEFKEVKKEDAKWPEGHFPACQGIEAKILKLRYLH